MIKIMAFIFEYYLKYILLKNNCPKEGQRWQDIGFQSDSSSTDLYSVGMFGALHILYGIK